MIPEGGIQMPQMVVTVEGCMMLVTTERSLPISNGIVDVFADSEGRSTVAADQGGDRVS